MHYYESNTKIKNFYDLIYIRHAFSFLRFAYSLCLCDTYIHTFSMEHEKKLGVSVFIFFFCFYSFFVKAIEHHHFWRLSFVPHLSSSACTVFLNLPSFHSYD